MSEGKRGGPPFSFGETRLVPMVEFLNAKGEVARYTYPRGMDAERWWESGLTYEEASTAAEEMWDVDIEHSPVAASAYDKLAALPAPSPPVSEDGR